MSRVLAWFSCGAASAVAAKLSVEKYGDDCEVCYCDTSASEHPDNLRFMDDVERWIGKPIKRLKSERYSDIYDVFRRTRFLNSIYGARCTTELKKMVRVAYQTVDDTHVFGFTSDEGNRIVRFTDNNPELKSDMILHSAGLSKTDCFRMLKDAGIELPVMYKLGYRNNNCIGCVKGGMGYWNKIRVDFPDHFSRMAGIEREIGVSICRRGGNPIYLDELPPDAGRMDKEPDIECGVLCIQPDLFQEAS